MEKSKINELENNVNLNNSYYKVYEKRYKLAKQLFEKTSIYFMKGDIDIKDIMWFIINFVTPNK